MTASKPPLGLMPLWRWRELHPNPTFADKMHRVWSRLQAIARYRLAERQVPKEWLKEKL